MGTASGARGDSSGTVRGERWSAVALPVVGVTVVAGFRPLITKRTPTAARPRKKTTPATAAAIIVVVGRTTEPPPSAWEEPTS